LVVFAGDGGKFPAVPFNAVIWPAGAQPLTTNAEIVRVTNRATDTLTITRAQESTSARTVVVGDQIMAAWTAKFATDIAADIAAAVAAPAVTVISDTGFLAGTSASFDFSSIPATYSHLRVEYFGRGDTAATNVTCNLKINNDTGANYDQQSLLANASTASAAEAFGATTLAVGLFPAATAPANVFARNLLEVPFYRSANNKVIYYLANHKHGTSTGNMWIQSRSGFWRSNSVIDRITLTPSAGNFAAGSRAILYGIL
jgi:hypothetical protein